MKGFHDFVNGSSTTRCEEKGQLKFIKLLVVEIVDKVFKKGGRLLYGESVWQIVTQISWARLLVQPTLGIDQCWLAKQKRTSLCLSTHQYFLLCYEMSFCHWSIGVTWHNPWLWLVRGKVVARQAGDNKINEMERLCSIIAVTNAPAPPSTAQCMVTACTRNVMCVTFVAKLSTS